MSYLVIAATAYLLNALAVLVDKFLLTKTVQNPLVYVFYISVLSLLALILIPFNHLPSTNVLILASVSTLAWSIGAYFLFSALRIGQADRVSPIIGILVPIFLISYYYLGTHTISLNEVWGALLSVFGLVILIWHYLRSQNSRLQRENEKKEFLFELLAALFFASSYIILKLAYDQASFLTVLAYSKVILVPLLAAIVIVPATRKIVLAKSGPKIKFFSKTGLLFFSGQLSGGSSQILLTFAISLANPALVNSLQGTQYAFLFIFSLILAPKFPHIYSEVMEKRIVIQRFIGLLFIAGGFYILAFAHSGPTKANLGFSYSPRYTMELGLDPKRTFIQALDDLSPKVIRLPIYWDEVEARKGQFDFSNSDFYVREASKRGIKLTLAIGYKVPRYPECFIPGWANTQNTDTFHLEVAQEISAVVNHYKNNPNVKNWQVENEILFPFGICPKGDLAELQKETSVVRNADPSRDIVITESGEFGLWLTTAKISDIVGISLYRRQLGGFLPWFKSPLPPFFYQFKKDLVQKVYPNRDVDVVELESEPWSNQSLVKTPLNIQLESFPVEDLSDNVNFSKEAGFSNIYLWGVEWWYYLKNLGHPEYVNQAILIFKGLK